MLLRRPPTSTLFPYTTLFRSERPADEVTGYRGTRWAPQGVSVRNPAFDVTPAELITGIICEKAVVDRKSTRLNSSHEWISYAVFCLKKKKKQMDEQRMHTHE